MPNSSVDVKMTAGVILLPIGKVINRVKRHVSQFQQKCTCAPGSSQGRMDLKCSGCQTNLRRSVKKRKLGGRGGK